MEDVGVLDAAYEALNAVIVAWLSGRLSLESLRHFHVSTDISLNQQGIQDAGVTDEKRSRYWILSSEVEGALADSEIFEDKEAGSRHFRDRMCAATGYATTSSNHVITLA